MINIYGKGGHAKMIASLLDESYAFYDDSDYDRAGEHPWIIGIGNNADRKKISTTNLLGEQIITVDAASYIASDAIIGDGIVFAPGSIVQNGVTVGDCAIINTSASVDHDCVIGKFCHIAPNSTLCGNVTVGDGTLIGAGSVVLPGITIGKNCVIGAGSVVTKDIPDNVTAYGNPCKIK